MGVVIFFLLGVLIGIFIGRSIDNWKIDNIQGIIDIDHDNNFYQIHSISKDVVDKKKTAARFAINHNYKISREEQIL